MIRTAHAARSRSATSSVVVVVVILNSSSGRAIAACIYAITELPDLGIRSTDAALHFCTSTLHTDRLPATIDNHLLHAQVATGASMRTTALAYLDAIGNAFRRHGSHARGAILGERCALTFAARAFKPALLTHCGFDPF